MRTLALTLAVWLLLAPLLLAKGVRYGMTPEEVEAALGKPAARLTQGERLVFVYPKSGRVEFEKNEAVRILNVALDSGEPAPAAAPAAPPARPGAAAKPPARVPQTDETGAIDDAKAQKARADFQRRLEQATERMEADAHKLPVGLTIDPARFWPAFVADLVLHALFTVAVLKLAFKWSDVHADWSQMILPALADTLTQAVIRGAAFALWKVENLYYIDTGISYFVLLFVLMKTTHACTLQRAVTVAGAAKLASIVLTALVTMVLLNLLR